MTDRKLGKFKDVELRISLVLGSLKIPLSKVLRLKEGDILTLSVKLEDYLEVRLNEEKFAIGELIVINDKVSLRLVDLA
ncbi:FliM/FliN family flagellar motor switch protein [Thermovibrio sp.]